MKLPSWLRFERKTTLTIDQLIARIDAMHATFSKIAVTPDTCEESPTVQAIVNAISMKISTLPVHVLRKSTSNGRDIKERLTNHPVERLLQRPNEWTASPEYWLDATSWLVRFGRYYAAKGRGATGPIRRLYPIHPGEVTPDLDEGTLTFKVTTGGKYRDYSASEMHYVRGRSTDGVVGDSPVEKAREAIGLEIAAQRFGASFFGNGALPYLVFKYAAGVKSMPAEQRQEFITDVQAAYGGRGRFKAMLMPAGLELGSTVPVENERAQFLETRQFQRTVIAGAFGVPPHLVGDLNKGTFNNVEQQSIEFQQAVILPYVRLFEAAMERDLLTDQDRSNGVVIRFNMDAGLRGDFKTRQEGLKIQREAGVISPNDWRETEGMNPRPTGGDEYWDEGPSGQGSAPDREPADERTDSDDDE